MKINVDGEELYKLLDGLYSLPACDALCEWFDDMDVSLPVSIIFEDWHEYDDPRDFVADFEYVMPVETFAADYYMDMNSPDFEENYINALVEEVESRITLAQRLRNGNILTTKI